MAFDTLRHRAGGETLSPIAIAHNSLFTAREKLDLLNELKAEAVGALDKGGDIGFSPDEIDAAIAEVRQGVQDGVGARTVIKGGF